MKGEILRYLGELNDAITYFNECIKYDYKDEQALFGLGISLIENKNFKEGVIYLSKWLKNNKKRLFKEISFKTLIIDVGWERTLGLVFELVDSNTVNLFINNGNKISILLPSKKDYIFMGFIPLTGDDVKISFPLVGKVYENHSEYKKTIQEIKKRVNLINFFNPKRFVTFDEDISVYIEEKRDCVYIEIRFKDYRISGLTDEKTQGYYGFIKQYEEYKDMQINICSNEKKKRLL